MTLEDRDDLTSTELLDLLIKSMTMLGYHQNSIKRSILELAEEYDMEVIQTKTIDEALDDAIRRENKEITTYWTRVIKEYQKDSKYT